MDIRNVWFNFTVYPSVKIKSDVSNKTLQCGILVLVWLSVLLFWLWTTMRDFSVLLSWLWATCDFRPSFSDLDHLTWVFVPPFLILGYLAWLFGPFLWLWTTLRDFSALLSWFGQPCVTFSSSGTFSRKAKIYTINLKFKWHLQTTMNDIKIAYMK